MSIEDNIKTFGSVREFVEFCERNDIKGFREVHGLSNFGTQWSGGSFDDALAYARNGDLEAVEEAERIVSKIDERLEVAGVRPTWTPSVCGVIPLVPAYLAGTPEAMLARADEETDKGDVEIWVDTSISGRATVGDMKRKGVIILATVMAVSRVRNVQIVVYNASRGESAAIRLSSPIDFSEVCAVLCQPCFTRKLMYGYSHWGNYQKGNFAALSGLPWAYWGSRGNGDNEIYERKALKEKAGMKDDALIFPDGRNYKRTDEEIISDINALMKRYTEGAR